jgi:hypothetical protein
MKYALIIGNSQYQDAKLVPLKTPDDDARALAEVLRFKTIGNFDEVSTLINETESKVRRAINDFLSKKKLEDLALLYFSGHGVLDSRGTLFLALKDTEIQALSATAIPASFISYEMDNCRSKRQILILDCCNSGAFARGTKGEQKAITESTFEGNGTGRVVLTASDATQFAYEGDQAAIQSELSLFTHFLFEGLKTGDADINHDGKISLDEWYDYSYTKVRETTSKQIPNKWSYGQKGELIIAQNPFLKKKEGTHIEAIERELMTLLRSHQSELYDEMEKFQPLASEYRVNLMEQWKQEYEEIIRYLLERLNQYKALMKDSWSKSETDRLFNAISLLSDVMGGRNKFIQNVGGVSLRKADIGSHGGEAFAHRINLSNKGTFSAWTVVHELAHAWDANYSWKLSRLLEKYTGGYTSQVLSLAKRLAGLSDSGIFGPEKRPGRYGRKPGCNAAGYFYGDKPSGSNWKFNRIEDFAEAVAMYVGWGRNNDLSNWAKARLDRYLLGNGVEDKNFGVDNWADYAKYFYPDDGDYTKTKRWQFIDDLVKGRLEIDT